MKKSDWIYLGIIFGVMFSVIVHEFGRCSQYTKGQIDAFQHVEYHCEGD